MRLLLCFAILITLVQTVTYSQQVSPSTAWTEVRSEEDGFSLEVPETFKYDRDKTLGIFSGARGEFMSGDTYLYAFVDQIKDRKQTKKVESLIRINRQIGSIVDLDGRKSTKYEFKDADGYNHTIVISQSESRSFAFHAISLSAANPSVARFIDSIRFLSSRTEKIVRPQIEAKAPENDPTLNLETSKASSGQGSGYGSAVGSGSGSGNGPGNGTQPPVDVKRELTPLKILSKQKAAYTDFARFYNISGTVTLRVTFLAGGSIGSVSVIKGLPFGLTGNSIYAVRQITFTPETVNGVPRTTSRPVSFTFLIY